MIRLENIHKNTYYFAFFVLAVIAFWQIAAGIHPVKYDMIDCYFPWRYFIGQNLQAGQLPLWNPYQYLGSPMHADPSSGIWYPPVWLIGSTLGYTVYTLGLELVIHVFLAGIGFFKLCKTLKLSNHTAFLAGASYMLCGLFVGNAQHLAYIVSACWLPYLLNYYLRMLEEDNYHNSIKAALSIVLMITGGYPAFTIIAFYLMLVFFGQSILKLKKSGDTGIKKMVLRNLVFAGLTLLMGAVMFTALYQVAPYITRTSHFTLKEAQYAPFSPQSFISFVLPFASVKNMEFFDTDMSMSNAYFGLMMFLFFILSFRIKKPSQFKIFFWFGLVSLMAAVGSYLPVRALFFHFVPMMGLFRFPSVFRLFVIIAFLLCAALWLEGFLKEEFEQKRKQIFKIMLGTMAVLGIVFLIFYFYDRLYFRDFLKHRIFVAAPFTSLSNHIAFQAALEFLLFGALVFVFVKVKREDWLRWAVTGFILLELIVSTRLNAPYTAYYDNFSTAASDEHIRKFPKDFPLPKDQLISDLRQDEVNWGPFWKNLNIYQKQVSRDGFNSFKLSNFAKLTDEAPRLFAATTHNKIGFLSANVKDSAQIAKLEKDSAYTSDELFLAAEDIKEAGALKHSQGDTAYLTGFTPSRFTFHVKSVSAQLLTLLQNDYPGWTVSVNGKEQQHYTSNYTLISALVPAGESTVEFAYDNKTIRIALWISAFSFIACLSIVSWEFIRRPRKKIVWKDVWYWFFT